MLKYLLLLLTFFLLFCNNSPTVNDSVSVVPVITIQSFARPYWFRDSCFVDFIYPSVFNCDSGDFCAFISTGALDYTCTVFPSDTFWGIIEYDMASPDTVICFSDTAKVLNDTFFYFLKDYFARQSDAICSCSAKAYTRNGFSYNFASSESKVRVYNSCFDTTFFLSFCLPKVPLDSQKGIWFETADTLFCPASLINGFSDTLTMQVIKDYSE